MTLLLFNNISYLLITPLTQNISIYGYLYVTTTGALTVC